MENVFQYTLKYKGRLKEITEFENIVIRANDDGTVLRLKDIATVELGAVSYAFHGETNGKPGVQFLCFQLAGANAKETNDRITNLLDKLSEDLPEGLEFVNMMSSNDFLLASIANVEETLIVAIILVILVVYFFLQDFRATIIPSISTPFMIMMFRQNSRNFPVALLEAARIDGETEFNIFFKMYMPIMKSTYAAAAVITFMNAWNSYMWPRTVMKGNAVQTMPMLIANLSNGYAVDYGMLMLGVLFCSLPTIIIFFVLQKQFAEGITGAVK